jgi:hypothetical protein
VICPFATVGPLDAAELLDLWLYFFARSWRRVYEEAVFLRQVVCCTANCFTGSPLGLWRLPSLIGYDLILFYLMITNVVVKHAFPEDFSLARLEFGGAPSVGAS